MSLVRWTEGKGKQRGGSGPRTHSMEKTERRPTVGPTVMMRVSTLSKAGWPDRWGPHVIDSTKIRKNKMTTWGDLTRFEASVSLKFGGSK